MAILKCKMCGGDILLSEDKTTGTCDHCGSVMTFPRISDEQKLNLYNRANHFRRQNEFDKAITAYERILEQDDTDAEAHWGAVLSRYGIEYVEDPTTHERIPTCHRVQLASILSDEDYLAAIEHAPDTASRDLYEQEARRIADIQKGILAISSQEKPYDVFICYKETDDTGRRTRDSALAQDIYYQLTNEGYKVFFSRITLEDKLGQQYEPYIFAALNSAKVMLVVGTKPEYFNAVWVKNEWSRYLALMKNDRSRLLIPCYRDMDPYDLPEELSALQSQDMSKIGFVQDLIRGVKKVLDSKKPTETKPAPPQITATGANIENLMKRVYLFMEDGDFASANEYLDKVLDEDAEYAPAYAGKVCTALGFRKEEQLAEATFLYGDHPDWKKALRFASAQQKAVYDGYYEQVKERVARQIRDYAYDCAVEMAVNPRAKRTKLDSELEQYHIACDTEQGRKPDGNRRRNAQENEKRFLKAVAENDPGDVSEQNYQAAAEMFRAIGDEEAVARAKECDKLAEQARQKAIYLAEQARQKAIYLAEQARQSDIYTRAANKSLQKLYANDWEKLAEEFASIPEYKDALARAEKCRENAEAVRKELYDAGVKAMQEAGNETWKWEVAYEKLNRSDLVGYRDADELRERAAQRVKECEAMAEEARRQSKLLAERQAAAAKKRKRIKTILLVFLVLLAIGGYFLATKVLIPEKDYQNAVALQQAGKYEEAIKAFEALNGYSDSAALIEACENGIKDRKYQAAVAMRYAGIYDEAITAFSALGDYADSAEQIIEIKYVQAKALVTKGDYAGAAAIFIGIKGYKDVDSLLKNDHNLSAAAAATAAAREAKYSVGNYVTFGHYPQTSGGSDSTEIEWLVVARDGQKALLLSRYGLDAKPYNTEYTSITWEKCTLRTWLNRTFLNKAFTAQEQGGILLTNVDNSKSQCYSGWSTSGGNNTQDKVFLLSYAEANKYLGVTYDNSNNTKSRVAPTAYAFKQGAGTSISYKTAGGTAAGWWWLRSPGASQMYAADVDTDGSLRRDSVDYNSSCVRPALWINLESDIF